jgi:hypothetical protein
VREPEKPKSFLLCYSPISEKRRRRRRRRKKGKDRKLQHSSDFGFSPSGSSFPARNHAQRNV